MSPRCAKAGLPKWVSSAFAVCLLGCAAASENSRSTNVPHRTPPIGGSGSEVVLWKLSDLAQSRHEVIFLRGPGGPQGTINRATARRIGDVADRVLATAWVGPHPEIVFLAHSHINAYAFLHQGSPTIAFTRGMVDLLGSDDDAWAALFGHEIAHLRLNHSQQRLERHKTGDLASSIAGIVLSALGLPFASLATDTAVSLADRAYSREDERSADRESLRYLLSAGFSESGAIRLQQMLLLVEDKSALQFLSTHPSGNERIDNLQRSMQSNRGQGTEL